VQIIREREGVLGGYSPTGECHCQHFFITEGAEERRTQRK
jgi:hypothetical protein